MPAARSTELARTTFQLLALAILIGSSFWIVSPFLVSSTWAVTIVVATWPLLLHLQRALGGRRGSAVAVMTAVLLLVLVVPLYFAITAIVDNAPRIAAWSEALTTMVVPAPPAWVETLPVVGGKLGAAWQEVVAAGPDGLAARVAPYVATLLGTFVSQVGSVGRLFIEFLLTVVIAAILYSNGESAASGVNRLARRLAGSRGENALHLAAQAVRAVALGVVVTAAVQSLLAGVGLAIAGVPFAVVLTAVMFILAVAQIGPLPVLLVAVIWVYNSSGAVWGGSLLAWSVVCGLMDSFLRPALIKRGADLPMLLIFAGVIGGLFSFGIVGLFIGPVVLAVAYTLLVDWVDDDDTSSAD